MLLYTRYTLHCTTVRQWVDSRRVSCVHMCRAYLGSMRVRSFYIEVMRVGPYWDWSLTLHSSIFSRPNRNSRLGVSRWSPMPSRARNLDLWLLPNISTRTAYVRCLNCKPKFLLHIVLCNNTLLHILLCNNTLLHTLLCNNTSGLLHTLTHSYTFLVRSYCRYAIFSVTLLQFPVPGTATKPLTDCFQPHAALDLDGMSNCHFINPIACYAIHNRKYTNPKLPPTSRKKCPSSTQGAPRHGTRCWRSRVPILRQ